MPSATSYLTSQEIAMFRSQLAQWEIALAALDAIEDCEGDLEDAAISLAIREGQQPDCTDWLASVAKRCRGAICGDPSLVAAVAQDQIASVVAILMETDLCSPVLVVPVALYAWKQGIAKFCEPWG